MESLFPGDLDVSRPTTPCGTLIPHPPAFKVKLKESTEILTGCTVRFAILVKGYPPPSLSFLKNNQPLGTDGRVRIICHRPEAFELVIEKADKSDSAEYKITAANHLGSDTTTGRLRVTMDKGLFPALSSGESSRCSTPRPASPMYRWFKNGVEFEAEDRFQCDYNERENTIALTFQHVASSDAGLYTCEAKTKRGKISCSAELKSEKTKAIFKRALTDFEARDGDVEVDLIVKLDGSPKPKVRWFFDGREIAEDDGFKFVSLKESNTHILRIQKVRNDMSGVFTCEAFNCEGKSETSGKLTVMSKPVILEPLRDAEVAGGADVTLMVRIAGFPVPEVTWLRNTKPILWAEEKIQAVTDAEVHKLIIPDVSSEDMAEYTCEALNVLGRVASSCNVRLSEKPCFKSPLRDNSVQLDDENITLTAELEPQPKVDSVKWFVDDIEIVEIDRRYEIMTDHKKHTYQLKIKKANEGTAGTYMCVASNGFGKSFSAAELRVASKPEFCQGLEDREAISGESVIMDVVISGNPTPEIQWFKDAKEIFPSPECKIEQESEFVHILTVEKVTMEAMADYECVIRNAVGESRTKGRLVVVNPPEENGFQDMSIGNFRVTVNPVHSGQLLDGDQKIQRTDAINNNSTIPEESEERFGPKDSVRASLKISEENVRTFGRENQRVAGQAPKEELINDTDSSPDAIVANDDLRSRGVSAIIVEALKLEENLPEFLCLKAKVRDPEKHDVKWLLDGNEIDVVKSKYCQSVDDDGSVKLVVRNPQACDAGMYSIRIGDGCSLTDFSVRVEPQSKNETLLSLLVAKVKSVVPSRIIGAIDKSQYNETTVIVGGLAVMAGTYLMMKFLFPNPLSDGEALSQAFAENVKEWVYKCSSAIGSCHMNLTSYPGSNLIQLPVVSQLKVLLGPAV